MKTLNKLLSLFAPKERKQLMGLLLSFFFLALIEMVGIASIMPFMALVADPSIIHRHPVFSAIFVDLGFSTDVAFLYFVGAIVMVVLVSNNLFSAFTQWLTLRVSAMCGHSISERLFSGYLSRPYDFYLNRNSAELTSTLFNESNRLISGVLLPAIEIVAKGAVILAIMLVLLIVDPMLALCVAIVMGGAYSIIFIVIRRYLTKIGQEATKAGSERARIANEAFGGIKEIKVTGKEDYLIKRYAAPSLLLAERQASSQALAKIPKNLLEIVAFGGILLITLLLIGQQQTLSQALPVIAVYAFAGYRLLPAFQQSYSNIAIIRYNLPALDLIYQDAGPYSESSIDASVAQKQTLILKHGVSFNKVAFQYPGSPKAIINDLSFSIAGNSAVAFVGPTGSGKTTTIDIILGLFAPQSGSVEVDGIVLDSANIRAWQRNVGYVPQHIYLSDDTITRNIALGEDDDWIDVLAVENAARIANIHDFIVNELPDGYKTIVGERGVRLSGGQKQRIGIARALYRNPAILILEEATSALDGITEAAIMETLNHLAHKKTIIVIAHRLSTVRACDQIFVLKDGSLMSHGTYDELMSESSIFRSMSQS